jgi:hypothetical protein
MKPEILFVLALAIGHFPDDEFTISKSKIRKGEKIQLSWSVADIDSVYISNIGKVKSTGNIYLQPTSSTTYVLTANVDHKITSLLETVSVEGTKGWDESMPNPEFFKFPIRFKTKHISLISLQDAVHHVLQDNLKFNVPGESWNRDKTTYTFVTNSTIKPFLVHHSEKNVSQRRVAYMVAITNADNPECTVTTHIEYRLKLEETWRKESSDMIHRRASDEFVKALNNQ